jgi:hypothetical protein
LKKEKNKQTKRTFPLDARKKQSSTFDFSSFLNNSFFCLKKKKKIEENDGRD